MASYVLPLALLLLLLGCTVNAEVVSLTDATFTDKVKEKDTVWFIKFFAPWCGHCTRLAPTWKELGAALEGEDGIEVAHVDCTTNKETCSKADVRSYPTLKVFYNGEEYKKYSGPRDLESLKKFATETSAEIVKANSEGEQSDI
ncbi:hypothetical protein R1flu_015401 [Riccia fluitans]|uniref:Thioredoxin domain-containing protein n=1 Tax=Riccia fluitans TaxID=41844 RepID=A0ABD1YJP4_9MARC